MKVNNKIVNRGMLYLGCCFFISFQHWRKEPQISFKRIFKELLDKNHIIDFNETSREDVFQGVINYYKTMISMQMLCYINEMIKEGGMDPAFVNFKNDFKNLKTKIDVDGVEKTTNAPQLLKIMRDAFAHNDDDKPTTNWTLTDNYSIKIQSYLNKNGDRHNITINSEDLFKFSLMCFSNIVSTSQIATEVYCNGIILENSVKNNTITSSTIKSNVKPCNKDEK